MCGNASGEEDVFIDFNGEYFLIRQAKLYTSPASDHIPICLAVTGSRSASGIITFLKPHDLSPILSTINAAAKMENKDPSSLENIAEYKILFSDDFAKAFEPAKFWQYREVV